MSYQYQWQSCDSSGANCANVAGATSSQYALGVGDVGSTLRVVVTASNAAGPSQATSAASPVIQQQTYSDAVLSDGPVDYYHFDEAAGATQAVDSGSAQRNSTAVSNATFGVPGAAGTAVSFTGASSSDSTFPGLQSATSQYSVDAWVKTTSAGGTVLTSRYPGDGSANSLTLAVGGGNGCAPGAVWFGLDTAMILDGQCSQATVNDGNWHQIVGTWSGIAGKTFNPSRGITIYVDGQAVGSYLAPDGLDMDLVDNPDGSSDVTWNDTDTVYHFVGGHVTTITTGDGTHLNLSYTSAGWLSTITDDFGHTDSFCEDASGDVTRMRQDGQTNCAVPDSQAYNYVYGGLDGRYLKTVTSPSGQLTTYTYDPLNRLTTIQAADGSTWTFGYDTSNRLTSLTEVTSSGSTTTTGYQYLAGTTVKTDPAHNQLTYDIASDLSLAGASSNPQPSDYHDCVSRVDQSGTPSADTQLYCSTPNRDNPTWTPAPPAYDPDVQTAAVDYSECTSDPSNTPADCKETPLGNDASEQATEAAAAQVKYGMGDQVGDLPTSPRYQDQADLKDQAGFQTGLLTFPWVIELDLLSAGQ